MTVNDRVWALGMSLLRNGPFLALASSSIPSYVHLQAVCFSVLALLAHRLVVCLLVDWWLILLQVEPELLTTFAWSPLVTYHTYSWFRLTQRFLFGFFLRSHSQLALGL